MRMVGNYNYIAARGGAAIKLFVIKLTDKYKLDHLIKLLDKAKELSGQFTGGHSSNFFSAEEFHSALSDSIYKLKSGDTDQLNNLWLWFAPTCAWDDFIHKEGEDLANDLFPLIVDLKKSLSVYTIG